MNDIGTADTVLSRLMQISRRIHNFAHVSDNLNTPVTMSWREPEPNHDTRTITALRAGDCVLDISLGNPGKPAVRSRRAFAVH